MEINPIVSINEEEFPPISLVKGSLDQLFLLMLLLVYFNFIGN